MATPVVAFAQLANECEKEGLNPKNAEHIGTEMAKAFGVQHDEVGILRVEKQNLVFVFPTKLSNLGSIPISSSGSVAGRAASTKRAEVINAFAQAKHVSVFESVELSGKQKMIGADGEKHAHIIQKLMVAPVLGPDGNAVGVIEVSRKGASGPNAGPDFSPMELQKLVAIAGALAKVFK